MPLSVASEIPASVANRYKAQPLAVRHARIRSRADAVETDAIGEMYSCFSTIVNCSDRGTIRSRKNTNDCSLRCMPYDPDQRRQALRAFSKTNGLKVLPWTASAGLSEATVRGFFAGRTRTLSDETYVLLAEAASRRLGRHISDVELRGERPPSIEVPVRHYVGAGDEVHLVDSDDTAIDYTAAPPGFELGAAAIVKGDSMRPVFDPGDMLFFRYREAPPVFNSLPARPVIVQVKNGPLLVKKLLPGTRRGHYHLLSVNPLTPILQDQPVESIARIGWIKPVEA
jgi:hypothetical protein